jgi:putative tryptophan/tyrosine transport system substrate-binding protein
MRRRDLLLSLSALGLAEPGASPAHAQTAQRVGYLSPESEHASDRIEVFLLEGLRQLGWVEGRNLTFVARYATTPEDLARAATDLVRLNPMVIVTAGNPATEAVKAATDNIPVVFGVANDPVRRGLIASLSRPGGNVTGLATMDEMVAKQLELLREMLPAAKRLAYIFQPAYSEPVRSELAKENEATAVVLGLEYQEFPVRHADEIAAAITDAVFAGCDSLLIEATDILLSHRYLIVSLAAQQRLPTISRHRGFVHAGGLASYGESLPDLFRRAATYVDKLLKGARPADLPVEQPTTFELAINVKTAKTLGLTIPPTLLARADEVIE